MAHLIYSVLPNPRRSIIKVHPDVSIAQCVDIMTKANIGALVVSDDINIEGILSERDIVRQGLYGDNDLSALKAGHICCGAFKVLDVDSHLEAAMQAMTDSQRRHVLVTERGELVAILSIGDVLNYLLEDGKTTIQQLEQYIHQ